MDQARTQPHDATDGLRRTGPIGRSIRLLGGLVLGAVVWIRIAAFVANGPAGYRDPSILGEASLWLLTAITVLAFVDFTGRFLPGAAGQGPVWGYATIGLAGAVGAAAVMGLLVNGSVWGFPLADLWWWFNSLVLAEIATAFIIAALVGLPGCEQGVWQRLLGRNRDEPPSVYACVIGLHAVDAWEWNQRDRRGGRTRG